MSTKHVFNSPDGLVLKSLRGATALDPSLRLHAASQSVYTISRSKHGRVAVISGGGAGHEPAHAGYTAAGMLSASVSGAIFASPSASAILTCVRLAVAAQQTRDVLMVVNNYTGDRLNFGLAAERARGIEVEGERIRVESVVVSDDVALLDRPSLVGARGLAGNILICKFLGAAAASGLGLSQLKTLGDVLVENLASVGVGLEHCHVPGRSTGEVNAGGLKADECELGMGLHNEPGVRKLSLTDAEGLIATMLNQIMSSAEKKANGKDVEGRKFVQEGDKVVLYVNNLGGISVLEMGAIVAEAMEQLAKANIHPSRVLCAPYMTSLNAPGFSLSLLNLSATTRKLSSSQQQPQSAEGLSLPTEPSALLSFLDALTEAPSWAGIQVGWPRAGAPPRDLRAQEGEAESLLGGSAGLKDSSDQKNSGGAGYSWSDLGVQASEVEQALKGACATVLAAEQAMTRFDTIVGDGDCGETFASGAKAVLRALDSGELKPIYTSPSTLIAHLADVLVNSMGGTSGALFGLYFTALSNALASPSSPSPSSSSKSAPSTAPLTALQALASYTPARPGDRTVVDALAPFCESLAKGSGFTAAVQKGGEGAESTRGMKPRLGRATYVGVGVGGNDESQGGGRNDELPPDPGAWGVKAILEGLEKGLGGGTA